MKYDVVIIGGGPAGLASACGAYDNGAKNILIIERDDKLGGILNQCIHNGFGLHTFNEELTGPEYASRFIDMVNERKIDYKLNSYVINISKEKEVTCISKEDGLQVIKAGAIILAMGCRERARGSLNTPGYRPAGIFSAGTAQKLINVEGYQVGKQAVILGSGDIGLIMARRLTLEGAKVECVAEIMPTSSGLKRNIAQCLDDYNIPLLLSHTVTEIKGKDRVEAVVISKVDEKLKPIPGTEKEYKCDTLLLSCGLIPENELSRNIDIEISKITNGPVVDDTLNTSIDGIFACGNVLHVHDLVDNVSKEALEAGKRAAQYALNVHKNADYISVKTDGKIRYTVPFRINLNNSDDIVVRYRVGKTYRNCNVVVTLDGEEIVNLRKIVMNPGEMETLTIKRSSLRKGELLFSLKEGE